MGVTSIFNRVKTGSPNLKFSYYAMNKRIHVRSANKLMRSFINLEGRAKYHIQMAAVLQNSPRMKEHCQGFR